MKKLLPLVLVSAFALASCATEYPTDAEIARQKKVCDINDQSVYIYSTIFGDYEAGCGNKKRDPVFECIDSYTEGIDEKYNNPDTVSNLREDAYSNVVKTCQETFGKKN